MSPAQHPAVVSISAIPESLEAFVALRDHVATTPEGGAVVMALALLVYAESPELPYGLSALTVAVDRSRLVADAAGYQGWALSVRDRQHLKQQVARKPWMLRSYVLGTSPLTGYRLPDAPYRFEVSRNLYSGDDSAGRVKVFVASSGADSPRPMSLQSSARGIWRAVEWSSLTVGVRPPVQEDEDGL